MTFCPGGLSNYRLVMSFRKTRLHTNNLGPERRTATAAASWSIVGTGPALTRNCRYFFSGSACCQSTTSFHAPTASVCQIWKK